MKWWQTGVIYQIYPRSFQDSNGDGVGDLEGIRSRLDYLQWLGIDAVWISPIFPSPMADFGYDVSNYTGVDPIFGTMEDFGALLRDAHARGIRILLDFVPNHSSDEHPWFIESRSSPDNPKRDWYIWRDPAPEGGPPNNWRSVFGGSAWELDRRTGQYYYHAFLAKQPDLNWRNPGVQQAMFDALRFWFELGVDGFRVDVIWHLIKDREFRNNPRSPQLNPKRSTYYELLPIYNADQPEVHEIIEAMRRLADGYGDRVLVGEIYLPVEKLVTYYGREGGGVHLPYNFQLIVLPWQARTISAAIHAYEALLPSFAWPNWVLGNHDKPRIASRVGQEQARVAAMMLLTLRGTPTIYYGDELGMENVPIPPEMVQDPYEKNIPGRNLGRDPERTPMQWTADRNAGFTTGKPWLPIAENSGSVNVAAEQNDPRSMLSLHKRLLELRRTHDALHSGAYSPVPTEGDLVAYTRKGTGSLFLMVLNFGAKLAVFPLPSREVRGRIALSTSLRREGESVSSTVGLAPNEGLIVEVG